MSIIINRDELEQIEASIDCKCQKYSGRGMYGEECFAIMTDEREFIIALVLAKILGLEKTQEMSEKFRKDSMGKGSVFYFPGYTFEE